MLVPLPKPGSWSSPNPEAWLSSCCERTPRPLAALTYPVAESSLGFLSLCGFSASLSSVSLPLSFQALPPTSQYGSSSGVRSPLLLWVGEGAWPGEFPNWALSASPPGVLLDPAAAWSQTSRGRAPGTHRAREGLGVGDQPFPPLARHPADLGPLSPCMLQPLSSLGEAGSPRSPPSPPAHSPPRRLPPSHLAPRCRSALCLPVFGSASSAVTAVSFPDTCDCGSVFFLFVFFFAFSCFYSHSPFLILFLKYRGQAPQNLVTFTCWELNLFAFVMFFTVLSPPVSVPLGSSCSWVRCPAGLAGGRDLSDQ